MACLREPQPTDQEAGSSNLPGRTSDSGRQHEQIEIRTRPASLAATAAGYAAPPAPPASAGQRRGCSRIRARRGGGQASWGRLNQARPPRLRSTPSRPLRPRLAGRRRGRPHRPGRDRSRRRARAAGRGPLPPNVDDLPDPGVVARHQDPASHSRRIEALVRRAWPKSGVSHVDRVHASPAFPPGQAPPDTSIGHASRCRSGSRRRARHESRRGVRRSARSNRRVQSPAAHQHIHVRPAATRPSTA